MNADYPDVPDMLPPEELFDSRGHKRAELHPEKYAYMELEGYGIYPMSDHFYDANEELVCVWPQEGMYAQGQMGAKSIVKNGLMSVRHYAGGWSANEDDPFLAEIRAQNAAEQAE
ncbi:MAG: hypothetical protein LBT36_00020 [Oscillospiraceae bacterium]|nr:hypothetical protein [Oscillospiraceae bacterium]